MAKKKDFIQYMENGMSIVEKALDKGMKVLKADGLYLDNYIIFWNDAEKFERLKNRKYMIVDENALCTSKSNHKLVYTDNESLVNDYMEVLDYEEILCEQTIVQNF